ncbi:MAG: hypothetical protein ACT6Q5_16060 [Sphingopyxis solisilvae]|uniref:hypothetical protein n=1 Tax=Sphingopyxis solisilvae TaxID=1886788 RepID=UPI0040357AC9
MTRSRVLIALLLSACATKGGAVDGPLYREEYASVEGVMQAIETCRGFGEDWDGWLNARRSEGWTITNLNSPPIPTETGPDYQKGASMKHGKLSIIAYIQFSSRGYVGKNGRCDVLMKVRSYDEQKTISDKVREKMNRVRPDWNAITYFSPTGKLSFNEEKSVPSGKPITFYVQVGYNDTKFVMPK